MPFLAAVYDGPWFFYWNARWFLGCTPLAFSFRKCWSSLYSSSFSDWGKIFFVYRGHPVVWGPLALDFWTAHRRLLRWWSVCWTSTTVLLLCCPYAGNDYPLGLAEALESSGANETWKRLSSWILLLQFPHGLDVSVVLHRQSKTAIGLLDWKFQPNKILTSRNAADWISFVFVVKHVDCMRKLAWHEQSKRQRASSACWTHAVSALMPLCEFFQ